jgi:hypothetical protein
VDAFAGAKDEARDRAITGEVVDADGKPAVGADVWLVGLAFPEGKAVVLGRAQADAGSRFRLVSPRPEAMSGVGNLGLWAYRRGRRESRAGRRPWRAERAG